MMTTQAVLYCRVSSVKQMTEGNGLASQENNCRNYAKLKGYDVLATFQDGVTGSSDDRRGLQAMLAFLATQPPGVVVIIDDLKRFAREVEVHFALKRAIGELGARLESPLFRFEDSAEGKFIETIVAAQAELERNQNKRQVLSRMRARLEMGYWVFKAPPGYSYQRRQGTKQLLQTSLAPVVQEALEGFASGRFVRVSDVCHFLERKGFFEASTACPGNRHGRIREMLGHILYTGWLEYPAWDVSLRQAHHEPLISLETHRRIVARLKDKPQVLSDLPRRQEFALRGVVRCASCGYGLTASWSRGEYGSRYAYYYCWKQGCSMRGKSVRADRLEEEFAQVLQSLRLTEEAFQGVSAWLEHQIVQRKESDQASCAELNTQLASLKKQEGELIENILRSRVESVQRALEVKVEENLRQQALLLGKMEKAENALDDADPTASVRTLLEEVHPLVEKPLLLWETGTIKERQLVARTVFSKGINYERKKGLRTPEYALCYRISGWVNGDGGTLVDPTPTGSNGVAQEHFTLTDVRDELQRIKSLMADFGYPRVT